MDFVIGVLFLFHFSDIVLTFYQFHMFKIKKLTAARYELNPVVKFIIKGNPQPYKMLLVELIILPLIVLIIRFSIIDVYFIGIITGALYFVNIMHISNIRSINRQWKNDQFWEGMRSCEPCVKN